MKKVILIEDDLQICEVIQDYFRNHGTEIKAVHDGLSALELVKGELAEYELILLDIMLPEADGFTICREIRKRHDIPVIFITARGREEDILYGYDIGCDDYIVKPFSLVTLYAKCQALVKRSKGIVISHMLECGAIRLDTRMLRCFVNGKELELPPKEFSILKYLLEHENWVIDRETLLNRIWGYDYYGTDRVVDNHIKKLRKALGTAGKQIKTIVGRGYKLTK